MRKHRYFYTENGKRVEELVNGKWVKVADQQQAHSHHIIRDQLGDGVKGVWNPSTNKRYDSKSRYYADTKAAGGEIVGNDLKMSGPPQTKHPEPVHRTIERLNQQKGWGL